MYALDALTGEEIWHTATEGYVSSSGAFVDGVVYIGSFDSKLYALDALDATSGQIVWSVKLIEGAFTVFSSPAVVDGVVYVGDAIGHRGNQLAFASLGVRRTGGNN